MIIFVIIFIILLLLLVNIQENIKEKNRMQEQQIEEKRLKELQAKINNTPIPTIQFLSSKEIGTASSFPVEFSVKDASEVRVNDVLYKIVDWKVKLNLEVKSNGESEIKLRINVSNNYRKKTEIVTLTRILSDQEIKDKNIKMNQKFLDDKLYETIVICEDMLKEKILTPSTAKFPDSYKWKTYVDESKIYLSSEVDFQNTFGATITKKFMCVIQIEWEKPVDLMVLFL